MKRAHVGAAGAQALFGRLYVASAVLALLLAVALTAIVTVTIADATEDAARRDIEAELRLLERRYRDLKTVAFADEIEYRVAPRAEPESASVYLLSRSDGSHVAGNLAHWPEGHGVAAGWLRFDGASAGGSPGSVLARASIIDGAFPLLVGRRLVPVDALIERTLPVAAVVFAAFLALALFATARTERVYRRRIAAMNAVFDRLRTGALDARITNVASGQAGELAELADNINRGLAEMQRLVRGLDAFSQTAAHELNRELTRLRDAARQGTPLDYAAAADNLIELLGKILTLVRIESAPAFKFDTVDIAALATEVTELYADAADAVQVELKLDAASSAGTHVSGVADLLRGVVLNLVENAIKHTPASGRVRIEVHPETDSVVLRVIDQGPGTASEDLGALIAQRAADAPIGHGFGLRFVQAVAIRHGIRITLRNLRPGLMVTLVIPRAR